MAIPSCCLAMSTTASDSEKCWELMSVLFSTDVQKVTAANGEIPVKQDVLEMVCQAFLDSESETDEVINSQVLASRKYGKIKITQDVVDDYLEAVYSADTLTVMDQRLYSIIYDEVNSYYTQNRSTEQIAESLMKRLDLYAQENYQ
ncbi:MAG: hypothetical protein J5636_06140 [Clostridiales bacterium]|nr:hypothetical protein [Clostridiales bacterium]